MNRENEGAKPTAPPRLPPEAEQEILEALFEGISYLGWLSLARSLASLRAISRQSTQYLPWMSAQNSHKINGYCFSSGASGQIHRKSDNVLKHGDDR